MESFVRRVSIILVFLVTIVFCLPVNKRFPIIPSSDQIAFMQKYGYLGGDPSSGFEAQYTEDSIVDAIINIQKFGGIEQTGVFDNKTKELMKKPRCGVKDVIYKSREKRYSVIRGWRKRKLTYYIGNWNPNLGETIVRSEIKRALDMWAPYGKLTFTPSSDPSSDIKILFGSGNHGDLYPFDGRGLVLAHAFFPHVRDGGSVHFDNDELWTHNVTDPYAEGTDFFSVAVHELGHALGLGHSQVEDSIMFAYYKGQPLQLDYDDVMGMYDLYFRRFDAIDEPERNNVDSSHESDHTEETTVTEASTLHYNSEPITESTTYGITYEGDYESVDDHIKHDTHGLPRTFENTSELCMGIYDTISVIRRELYVFKDTTIWRFQRRGVLYDGYPTSLFHMFPHLPLDIKRIDAAYENINGDITFFSGNKYWIYDFKNFNAYNLENYSVQNSTQINAILLWPVNNKTYLFDQNKFWRFNEYTNTLDNGYPKSMMRWRGIPDDINAAIYWIDGHTYFFKGKFYWRFDSNLMASGHKYPLPAPQWWFGCMETQEVFPELRKVQNVKIKTRSHL